MPLNNHPDATGHSPRIDDKLLELVTADAPSGSRFGLIVTLVVLLLILILSFTVARFINVETRRLETEAQATITQTLSRQIERRLLDFSNQMQEVVAQHEQNGHNGLPLDCKKLRPIFERNPEFLEFTYVNENHAVQDTCLTRSALYTAEPRRIGEVLTQPAAIETVNRAVQCNTLAYSEPYARADAQVAIPMVDLVIPAEGGGAFLARISLTTLVRIPTDPSFDFRYRTRILVDGKPFRPADSAAVSEDSENIRAAASLAPLPANVSIETTNTARHSFYTHTTLLRGMFFFGGLLILAILSILRSQYLQLRTESELRARVIVQQAMSQSFIDGLIVADLKGRILFTNRSFDAMFGYENGALLDRDPPYGIICEPKGVTFDSLIATVDGQNGAHAEMTARRADGSTFDCTLEIVPLRSGGAEEDRRIGLSGWLMIIRDVTQQKQAHRSMMTAHERTMRVLESMDAMVCVVKVVEEPPELLFANKRYVDFFGHSPEAHMRLCTILRQPGPVANISEIWDPETRRWFAVSLREVSWIGGTPVEILTMRDVTERRDAQAMLEHQIKNAEQSSRLITMGEMASSLAHELNQPLAAVQNYASASLTMLKSGKLSSDGAETALNKIINQTQRAAQIIKRIRGFARRNEPLMAPTELSRILEETMELADLQSRKLGVPIELQVQTRTETITCDAVLIEQVLVNLLKNAMEASHDNPTAGVTLRITEERSQMLFCVVDRGCGISEEAAEHLFSPFFTTKKTGMGIGLNICRSIVESHHGRLTFERNPEGGTTFRMTLPLGSTAIQ